MAQIFISYSKQDIEFAKHLRSLLQSAGFEVWLDERLVPSTQWWRTLESQIKKSTALIVIMSPSAAESRWVEREILVAENANLPIFPILLAGEGWSRLADIQYEDFTAGLNATLPPRFIDALRAVIDGTSSTSPTVKPVKNIPSQTESRLLELAMPAETKAGSDTEMWAKISLPDSAGLRSELPAVVPSGDVIQRGDARTTSFPFRFPTDLRTGERLPAHVTLKALSADFIIRSPGGDDSEFVELPPDSDSRTIIFTLLPKPGGRTSGRARIFLDLIYESRVIAQISVSTQMVEQVSRIPEGAAPWGMWSVPVGSASAAASGYGAPGLAPGAAAGVASGVAEVESMPDRPIQPITPADEVELEDWMRGGAASDDLIDDVSADVEFEEARSESPAEAPEEDWRTALPPAPFPPPIARPSTRPRDILVDEDRGGEGEASVPQPQAAQAPKARARGRVLNFPAVSAIAGMALVFVIVLFLTTNRTPNLSVQQTVEASTNTALSIAAETQNAVIGMTDAAEFPSPTPLLTATVASVSTPIPSSDRTGIAATRLIGCVDEEQSQLLIDLLDQLNIASDTLSGATDDEFIQSHGMEMESGSHALVIRGSCENVDQAVIHADLLAAPEITGLLHPDQAEIRVPFDDMADPEGTAATFLRALEQYVSGNFDAELLRNLSRVFDAIEDDTDNVIGIAQLQLLMGNAHLLFDNGYDAALSRFNQIDPDSDIIVAQDPVLIVAALNNAGFAEFSRAISDESGAEEVDEAVENAQAYFNQALQQPLLTEQQATIQINLDLLDSFILSRATN